MFEDLTKDDVVVSLVTSIIMFGFIFFYVYLTDGFKRLHTHKTIYTCDDEKYCNGYNPPISYGRDPNGFLVCGVNYERGKDKNMCVPKRSTNHDPHEMDVLTGEIKNKEKTTQFTPQNLFYTAMGKSNNNFSSYTLFQKSFNI